MKINVFHVPVGADGKTVEIQQELSSFQEIVGGYIQVLPVTDKIDLYLNEEGKLEGLANNFYLTRNAKVLDLVVGDVFFASHDSEGNTVSLTDEQVEEVKKRFHNRIQFEF